jgi:c-di-GMP-binding flagellar brake protein YcgR
MGAERRLAARVPVKLFCDAHLGERRFRAVAFDLSDQGVALWRLGGTTDTATEVGLEIALPGSGELIWARARTEFQQNDRGIHRAGLRFVDMAHRHRRLLHDFVMDRRLRVLALARRPFWARLRRALQKS